MKYKVGDRVVCTEAFGSNHIAVGKKGTVKEIDNAVLAIEFDEHINGHTCTGSCKDGHGWWSHKDLLKAIPNNKIVITTDGIRTSARLYEGNKVIKSAQAICSPDDEFNFDYGARLAFDRLVDKPEIPHKWNVGDEVVVENSGRRYPDYPKWFGENGLPELELRYTRILNEGETVKILAYGKHRRTYTNETLYAVEKQDGKVGLIGESGLADKPEFKPHLMYRSINNGTVGVETKYKDVVGRKLYVGDVVELFNSEGMSIGLKFISEGNAETDKIKQFVMGISGNCNGETGEIKGGWKVFKTRGYETLKHGEVIDGINYVGENT